MNLKDLSQVVTESIQCCIDNNKNLENVDVLMIQDDYCVPVNSAQLRFSDVLQGHGVLIFENDV